MNINTTARALIVIPAYNEEATIEVLIESVLHLEATQLLVINDASSDNTASLLKEMQSKYSFKVIENDHNQGKAACLWSGFDYAMKEKFDVVVTMDGDGQHRADDVPALLEAHQKYPQHLIIGARERNLKTQPLARFLANRFANFWISWAAGYGVQDSQSGFRLYPCMLLEKILDLKDKSEGFVFESEVIIEAAWQGHYTQVINIPTIYHKNRRASHFQPWQDIKKITKMVSKRLVITHFNLADLYAALANKPPKK